MTQLTEILSFTELDEMIQAGYVRKQQHPIYTEYSIFNYTEKAAFERVWNDVTRITRGLIVNTATAEVLARPFQKIHNWDEAEAPAILDWNAPVFSYSNKFDGSLGILYREPSGRPAIATRGSFASDQAIKATEMLHASGVAYVWDEWISEGYTPLFEIIYPENRIVLDYGQDEFLQPLGMIHIATGAYIPAGPSPVEYASFAHIMQNLSRDNAEGWVVWTSPYKAVKLKQADYVELHRIVTGLNRKSVWRALSKGENVYKDMAAQLPDELYDWAEGVAKELREAYAEIVREVDGWYTSTLDQPGVYLNEIPEEVDAFWEVDRPVFAKYAKAAVPGNLLGLVFATLDGKDIQARVWQMIEPVGNQANGYKR